MNDPKKNPTIDECNPQKTKTVWCSPTKVKNPNSLLNPSQPCPVPEKTPADICCCKSDKPCPVHLEGSMTFTQEGCDPHPCVDSIPPNLGCVPVRAGVGLWDGGVPAWMNACITGCELEKLQECYPYHEQFIMSQGESLLDLDTNPEGTTNLQVIGNGIPRQINIREFYALAVKMYETGRAVTGGVNPDTLSLGYVKAADGTMSLSIISEGLAVGQGLALVTTKDADGKITAVNLPLPA